MKDTKIQNQFKSSSQVMYSPPISSYTYTQNNYLPKISRPKPAYQMNDRQLLKQQFYLSRFIKTLQSNTSMPTLPNQSILLAIKRQNQLMQQKVQAFRTGTYEQYLFKKFNSLNKQMQQLKTSSRVQISKNCQRQPHQKHISY